MHRYVAHILSTHPDRNGIRVSEEAIKDFLENKYIHLPIPVRFDFEGPAVGLANKVKEDRLAPGNVLAEMDIIRRDLINDFTRVVPDGLVISSHEEDGMTVIDKFKITSLNLTINPADSSLRAMEKLT